MSNFAEHLFSTIHGAVSSDAVIRGRAFEQLQSLKAMEGYATALFQLASIRDLDMDTRLV
jgi:hypothetical protein